MTGQRSDPNSSEFRRMRAGLIVVIVIAMSARLGILAYWGGQLEDDPDAYRGIAANLADGNGFSLGAEKKPTAFRPPLYPLILAGLLKCGGGAAVIGLLHLLLGTATAALTFLLGRRWGMRKAAVAAGVLVAVDPLLLKYTTQVMTEVCFTFLTLLFLFALSSWSSLMARTSAEPKGIRRLLPPLGLGIALGLCALCRPTIWAFAALLGVVSCWIHFRNKRQSGDTVRFAITAGAVLVGVTATVAPWVIRNVIQFDRPILTTTHGGYTLLLGNNPVFYREVVARRRGTVWKKQSLLRWQRSLETEIAAARPKVESESERDVWMYRRARQNISNDPLSFAQACWLRFSRFWNAVPLITAGGGLSGMVRWSVGVFYLALTASLLLSLWRMPKSEWENWLPLLLLLLSFTAVHLLYWSNTRMRAPLIPAIALLAARILEPRRKTRSTEVQNKGNGQ